MKSRCYRPADISFKNYGGKGVTVCEEWQALENFFSTIDQVKGYDADKLLNGELQLDKDYLIPGNKVYSPDTCCFISAKENAQIKPNRQKAILAIGPEGRKATFNNTKKFAQENNLNATTIADCLSGRVRSHRDWVFMYAESGSFEKLQLKVERKKLIQGLDPFGNTHHFVKLAEFGRKHGLDRNKITMCVKGKRNHHKGWKFTYKEDE